MEEPLELSDDLNKPLGQKPQKSAGTGRTVSPTFLLALLALVAVTGLGVFTVLRPAPAPQTIVVTASETTSEPDAGSHSATKDDDHPVREPDPDAPPIQELEATGEMVEPQIPVPSRPVREFRQDPKLAHNPDPALLERVSIGVLPRVSDDGKRPMDAYSREPDTVGNFGVARVVIVVSGLGISQTSTQAAIRDLPGLITLGFAPYGNSLSRWMQEARKDGHEIVLQVPMEPFDYPANNPGAETLRSDLDETENIANLHWAMSRITNYVGITNFLGGKFMGDRAALQPVMDEMAERGLLFLDDGSIRNTATEEAARAALLPYAKAHIRIDAVRSRAAIKEQLLALEKQAKRTGMAIGVANAFPESIDLISQFARQADKAGIELTPLSSVVKVPGS